MSVSRTISEIFSVKEWRELETGVRGRSRSLKMAPFNRSYTTFYWSAIASIALCCTIFLKIFVLTAFTNVTDRRTDGHRMMA